MNAYWRFRLVSNEVTVRGRAESSHQTPPITLADRYLVAHNAQLATPRGYEYYTIPPLPTGGESARAVAYSHHNMMAFGPWAFAAAVQCSSRRLVPPFRC